MIEEKILKLQRALYECGDSYIQTIEEYGYVINDPELSQRSAPWVDANFIRFMANGIRTMLCGGPFSHLNRKPLAIHFNISKFPRPGMVFGAYDVSLSDGNLRHGFVFFFDETEMGITAIVDDGDIVATAKFHRIDLPSGSTWSHGGQA